MLSTLKHSAFALTVLSLAGFVGCGGSNLNVKQVSSTANPTDQIAGLDTDSAQARNEKVNVLAPSWFSKAEASLTEAQEIQKEGGDLNDLFEATAKGRAEINKANEVAGIIRTALPNAIKARDDARSAGATNFEREYGAAELEFTRLTGAVEKNDLAWAQRNEPSVTKTFRDLELRAIKERALGTARTIIREIDEKNGRKLVPESFAKAETSLKNADAFISQNRYDKDEMTKKANEALFYANRLQNMFDQTTAIQKMTPERTSVWVEGMLSSLAKASAAPDMRDQSFKTQVDNIAGSIDSLKKDRDFLGTKAKENETAIASLNEKVASLEGMSKTEQEAKARLEAEKKFNERYNEVRTFFASEEAEVYKEGDALLLRLKTIQFPVGQAVIMPDNYPVLSKVQRAIRTFGEPQVTIEGHTDSTGSAALNEQLSQERADAVKQYLVANQTLGVDKIVPVGFGPNKPIAPNTTTAGRAMNRRIDVVIQPQIKAAE